MSTVRTPVLPAGAWKIDPAGSRVGFAVRHLGVATVKGTFTDVEGTVTVGEAPGDMSASGSVAVASVDTGDAHRDEALRSAFFDDEAHPRITFVSTAIEARDGGLRVTGDFTMQGVTRELVLTTQVVPAGDGDGAPRLRLTATGKLSRRDFSMRFKQAMGAGNKLVDDAVKLELEVSAVPQG